MITLLRRPQAVHTEPFDVSRGGALPTTVAADVIATPQQLEKVYGTLGATAVGRAVSCLHPGALASLATGLGVVKGANAQTARKIAAYSGYNLLRMAGACVGGFAGVATARVLNALHVQVPVQPWMVDETRGFSLKDLPARSWDSHYSSHPRLGDAAVQKVLRVVKPGDVIVSNQDYPDFELALKMLGDSGNWGHAATFIGPMEGEKEPQIIEMVGAVASHRSLGEFMGRENAVMVLRPKYDQPHVAQHGTEAEVAQKIVDWDKAHLGMTYDYTFSTTNMKNMYCLAMPYHALDAVGVHIEPTRAFGVRPVVTPGNFIDSPDLEPVYSTGGHYRAILWSQFD